MQRTSPTARRLSWIIASVFVFSLALAHHSYTLRSLARDPFLVATDTESESPGRVLPRWIRRHVNRETATRVGKNHELVHQAFYSVVEPANKSTVKIMSGKEQRCLGIIVHADGYILTKASELPDNPACQVPQGDVQTAERIAVDPEYDLALLKIDASNLTAAKWETAAQPRVGAWLAVPSGVTSEPVAVGVMSVRARSIAQEKGFLGIQLDDSSDGPRIAEVLENSGAKLAGLLNDDVVLSVNQLPMPNSRRLIDTVRTFRPGEKLTLRVRRGSDEMEINVELTRLSDVLPDDEAMQNTIGGDLSRRRSGFSQVIQHDTLLSPNQCGGPLVDVDGKIVGMNIARAGRVATYALTANVVQQRLESLLAEATTKK